MADDRRRVVVTGMGAVSALGPDVASTWDGLVAGRSGVRTIEAFDPARVDSKIAAEVRDFDASDVIDRKDLRRMDRYIQFGLVVARQAMRQAGLPDRLDGRMAERTGVYLGSGLGGVATLFDNVLVMADRGPDRISPFFIPMGIANVGSGQIAISFGQLGPNFAIVSACATGAHAIGEAWETIRRGDADRMLAGGVEAAIHEAILGGFSSMKALSTRNDDPAAASHITLPSPGGVGAVRAARRALEKAGLSASEVEHVNAHATSTPEGDRAELQGLRTLLGERAPAVAVTANKSMLGHTLGAAGALESVATIQTLRLGVVPPTINLENPDEAAAGLDLTPGRAATRDVRVALNNSFGFGGQNAALVFRRWDG
jgi:3-oxoacyl-[acyl-carrier-protein] synthase II